MNKISGVTNPYQKFIRQASNFDGTYLNMYPWPVNSTVSRIKVVGSVTPTAVTVGSLLTQQANVYAYPETIILTSGEYNDQLGFNSLDPSNIGYLQMAFNTPLASGSTVIVEGYATDTKYNLLDDYTVSQYGQLEPRYPVSTFSRYFLGNSTTLTNNGSLTAPIIFKPNSISVTPTMVLNNGQYLYIGSNTPFRGIQFNLANEDYTNSDIWQIKYWNGAWASVTNTIVSSLSCTSTSNITFNQSGVILFNYVGVSGWTPLQIPGDPYVANLAIYNTKTIVNANGNTNGNTYASVDLAYNGYQYWIQLVPPTPNNFTVNICSINIYSY